jgi:RNA polymerase sigma-70 factor (ECF subfamily)
MVESIAIEPSAAAADHAARTDTASAFARLYQEHAPAVFNYCLFRVGDASVAEDLTADVFERAWRARRRYDPRRAQFSTWLFATARRRVTDWQRRQARRGTLSLRREQPSALPGPYSAIAEADDRHRLRLLVQALPDADRELIAMKFGAGMTNRQIAKILGKSETAIGSAVYRLVGRLRQQWEES